MNDDLIDFDPGEPLPTVDRVGLKTNFKDSPLMTIETSSELDDEIYNYHVRGWTDIAIAKKLTCKVQEVKVAIAKRREELQGDRRAAGTLSVEDSITYYQHLKVQLEERAKYSDDKNAPQFYAAALEAQNRIDKLMGLEGDKGRALPSDQENMEGLVIYRERRIEPAAETQILETRVEQSA